MVLDALPRRTRRFKRVFDRIEFDLGVLEDVGSASLMRGKGSVRKGLT
jgi:hypothetical protein